MARGFNDAVASGAGLLHPDRAVHFQGTGDQLQRVRQAKQIIVLQQFTRTTAPHVIEFVVQAGALIQHPVDIRRHIPGKSTLFLRQYQPAGDEDISLSFRLHLAIFSGSHQGYKSTLC